MTSPTLPNTNSAMKVLLTLSILCCVHASALHLDRGASNRPASAENIVIDGAQRQISSPQVARAGSMVKTTAIRAETSGHHDGEFDVHHGYACRYKDFFTGSPEDHEAKKDSNKYFHKIHADEHECRHKCLSNHHCTGYEYKHKYHCELWKMPIGYFVKKHGFVCKVKKHSPHPKPIDPEFHEKHHYACRYDASGAGGPADPEAEGSDNKYFHKIYADEHECRHKCLTSHHCTGYEYSHGRRCELWKLPIKHFAKKSGFKCVVKI